MNAVQITLVLISLFFAACGGESTTSLPPDDRDDLFVDGRADGFVIAPSSPEAEAVLALVNRPIADLAEADNLLQLLETKLHPIPAEGILAFRLGPDELPGGPVNDDREFDDLGAVDAIPYVGPVALGRLFEIADDEGLYTQVQHTVCPRVGFIESQTRYYGRDARVWSKHADLIAIQQSGCTKVEGLVRISVDELRPGFRQLEALENITEFDDLVIEGMRGLEGLDGLRSVTQMRSLYVHNSLPNLHGLEGLTHLYGALDVSGVDSLDGLNNLQAVGALELSHIEDVSGLSNLRSANSMKLVWIESFEGLHNVERVDESIYIEQGNQSARRMLPGLVSIGAMLRIHGTDDLLGFDSLESIGGLLRVGDSNLDVSDAFASLAAVGSLHVESWSGAADLTGFSNLEFVGGLLRIETKLGGSLEGLGAIETIEGDLNLIHVRDLADFDSLQSLSALGGDLRIPSSVDQTVVDAFVLSLDHFNGDVDRW